MRLKPTQARKTRDQSSSIKPFEIHGNRSALLWGLKHRHYYPSYGGPRKFITPQISQQLLQLNGRRRTNTASNHGKRRATQVSPPLSRRQPGGRQVCNLLQPAQVPIDIAPTTLMTDQVMRQFLCGGVSYGKHGAVFFRKPAEPNPARTPWCEQETCVNGSLPKPAHG